MKTIVLSLTLAFALANASACSDDGSSSTVGPDYLGYLHITQEFPTEESTLLISFSQRHLTVLSPQYDAQYRADFTDEEFTQFLVFATREKNKIYSDDYDTQLAPGPDCAQEQAGDVETICKALELAEFRFSANAMLTHLAHDDPEIAPSLSVNLSAPTSLSIETAEYVLFLEALRVRVLEEGEVIDVSDG
ncbi:MAG: hypothetical protein JKY56_14310 [Kofleriaceae bacterium]|nr:hypothetical protein [Kofleriaceae bacterium]